MLSHDPNYNYEDDVDGDEGDTSMDADDVEE